MEAHDKALPKPERGDDISCGISDGSAFLLIRNWKSLVFGLLCLIFVWTKESGAQTLPSGFSEQVVLSGLTKPTVAQFAPDGRVFVAEKSGLIKVFSKLGATTPTVFADLRANVYDFGKSGLLGMALHPSFPSVPYVYVLYTYDGPVGGSAPTWGDSCPSATGDCVVSARLSRLRASGDVMTGAEQVLVWDWYQRYPDQPVGSLAFGPDGALYASAGDGAGSTFVDFGQGVSPSPDPPNQGGALRSQDLRSPADPVALSGSIIRVHPDTGQPLPQTTSMLVGPPTADANGVKSYEVTSVFQGPQPTVVRVLEPTNPAPGAPRRFLYVLPVQAGVTDLGSTHSDGLEELRLLDVHNRYNLTLIAPSFHIEPWYGDHHNNPDRQLESYLVRDLVPFGDSFASPGVIPQRWVLGFSKSGAPGALSLILRHPNVFSAAAAWDAPAQFTDMSAFPGMAENFGTEQNFDRYEIPTLVIKNREAFLSRNRIWISGDDSAWTSHMIQLHDQMLNANTLHTWVRGGPRIHSWYSGWLDGAVAALNANASSEPSVDINAQRIIAYGLRNPSRLAFRPGTGELWIGDAGLNEWEEINRIVNAADGVVENFGSPCYANNATTAYAGLGMCTELYSEPPAATPPVYAYSHNQQVVAGESCAAGGGSISGLAFYETGAYPISHRDALFFSDVARNCIWVMPRGVDGLPDPAARATFMANAASPVDLRTGPGGDLFYVDFSGGTVRRISHTSPPADTTPPLRSNGSPSGTLAAGTTQTTLIVLTNENATCRYATSVGTPYTSMSSTFSSTGGVTHSTIVSGLSDGGSYSFFVRCQDTVGNANTDDYTIGFIVANPPVDTTPPVRSNGSPSGALAAGTTQTTLSLATNENATCRYATTAGVAFGSMPNTFSATGGATHSTTVSGLSNGGSYSYFVRCQDTAGNVNTNDFTIGFSVAGSPTAVTSSFSGIENPLSENGMWDTPGGWNALQKNNGAYAVSLNAQARLVTPALGADQYSEITYDQDPGSSSWVGVTTRVQGAGNGSGYLAIAYAGEVRLYRADVSGDLTFTLLASASASIGTAPRQLRLESQGNNHKVYFNGNQFINHDASGTLYSNGQPGIAASVFGGPQVKILTFTGGNLDASSPDTTPPVRSNGSPSGILAAGTTQTTLSLATNESATCRYATTAGVAYGSMPNTFATTGGTAHSTTVSGLSNGGSYSYFVRCQESAGNANTNDFTIGFSIAQPPADTTAPVRSNGSPSGVLAAGTTQTTLSLATSENATCRYATTAGVAYASMPNTFATTGGATHSTTISGLSDGGSYSYFVRCQDVAGNANTNDFTISFSVALPPADTTAPVRSNGSPSGALVAGTTQTTLSLATNESATCRYATTAGTPYASMPNTFATTGGATHSTTVSGLSNGGSYSYFVRCQDIAGNANTNDFTISFSVALPGTAGLVAAYGFNEGTGTSVADASGNGHAGVISGAAWSTQGKFGNALSFDGVNDWVTVNATSLLNLTSAMTLEAWVFPTVNTGVREILIKEGTNADIYNLYARNGNGRPESNVFVGGTNRVAQGTAALAVNVWTHVAGTYDGTTLRLFINGVQNASIAVSGPIATSTGALRIGGNSLWGEFFQGRIDEIRIYNRALSQTEIQTDMNTPVGGAPPDSTAPVRSNGSPSGTLATGTTQTTLSLTTNENATCRYATTAGVAYGSMPNTFATTGGTAQSTTVSGLVTGGSYSYFVRCQDTAGNANTNDFAISFSVGQTTADTIPPTVAITSPPDSASLAGVVTITADASDNVGVVGVQFLLNGASLGSEITSAPYSMPWDTTTVAGGAYTLTARARDAAGNSTTSAPRSVAVTNNPVPSGFRDEVVIGSGLMLPTAFEFLPDGRMLITEFRGRVLVAQPGASVVDPTPVLDLPNIFLEDVIAGGERGLVNVVADPDFANNRFIYAFYTAAVPQRDRVSRFTMNGNVADPASELVVWQAAADSTSTDHHGGGLAFGPDGKLYISTGDNGNPPTSQPLTSDHGKILRVNKDGTIPTDNPFFDGNGPNIDAIWARGLRNPYRFSFDPANGRMYIGDVGQSSVEEINIGVRGANYGWPTCEGSCTTSGMTNPLYTYPHSGRDAAVTGGFVYRGTQFPPSYQGVYFYGDFAQNWIKYLTLDASGNVTGSSNFLPADGSLDGPYDPVMLKQGPDGSLYYVDFGWGWQESTANPAAIRRIRYVAANQPPVAAVSATPRNGQAPLSVSFSSAGSFDPEGQPLTYSWTFGDGGTSNAPNPVHVYAQSGQYAAQLSLSDGTSTTLSDVIVIAVGSPPQGTITSPPNGLIFRAGDVISFAGTATDPQDGTLPASAYSWTILFHHDSHVHPALGPVSGLTSGTFTIPTTGHDFSGNTRYEIILKVTDSTGLQHTSSVFVLPHKVNVTFATSPAGLTVSVDGISASTPFVKDTLTGFQHTINAPSQTQGTTNYVFASWSDGGAQSHTVTAPETATTYTATYQAVDTTAPVRSNGSPSGTLAAGTTQTTLSLATNESATCRYATIAGVAYASMTNTFATTGGATHSTTVSGLSNGGSYTYFVRCQDVAGNANTNDFTISFSVALPATAGLVAAYGFNEGTGTSLADLSGNGHTGVISGATWSTQGKFGNALSFDGVNDWVTVNATSLLNLTSAMTLEAWVFPTVNTAVRDILVKEGSNVDVYNLYSRSASRPEANVLVGGSNRMARGTAALAVNVWTHVAGTYDGTTLRLFINGVQVSSTAASGPIATSTGPLRIGGNSIWGEFFQGRIDEIRIYNRALSQAEIQTDMNTPVAP